MVLRIIEAPSSLTAVLTGRYGRTAWPPTSIVPACGGISATSDRSRLAAVRLADRGKLRRDRDGPARAGRRAGAGAQPVHVGGPLHARPDERHQVLRPAVPAGGAAAGRRDRLGRRDPVARPGRGRPSPDGAEGEA